MKTFDEHWQEIENNFNFYKVYDVMKLLNWTWGQGDDASIPSVRRIKARAKSLCHNAYKNEHTIGSGGFCATFEGDIMWLEFTIEEWCTE